MHAANTLLSEMEERERKREREGWTGGV